MNFKCNNAEMIMLSTEESYPVGAIIVTHNSTNPSTYIKTGTWELVKSGTVLVGVDTEDEDFSTVEKTGGKKTCSLYALIGAFNSNGASLGYAIAGKVPGYSYHYGGALSNPTYSTIENSKINHHTSVLRMNCQAPSTMQPYMVAYIWKRTA